jgi:hypothetical protein
MPDAGVPVGQSPECRICPICAGLGTLREARPEAVEHLVKAGAELLLAARALLEAAAAPPGQTSRPRGRGADGRASGDPAGNGIQRIDIG